jgi:3-deoxy-D-manno-octulosonic-acid transferase
MTGEFGRAARRAGLAEDEDGRVPEATRRRASGMTGVGWRLLAMLLAPLVGVQVRRRESERNEDPNRAGERHGYPSRPRPAGTLAWLHADGVGEAMAALILIDGLLQHDAKLNVLLTTSSVASARLMVQRLPKRAEHQYAPNEHFAAVQNFLDHWHPDLAIWVGSEFRPNLILETYGLGTPMMLLNAHISAEAFRRWSRSPALIRQILHCFDLCVAESMPDAGRLGTLGAEDVTWVGNLRAAAAPLPAEARELERMRRAAAERPCWLAASTHPGEEAAVARAHRALARRFPGLLTFIVPHRPERGEEIREALRRAGFEVSRRSGLEPIRPNTEIYLADTLGELGVFYRALPLAFIGGSLVNQGGHNPLEAVRLDCAVLFGPHMENFAEDARILVEAGAGIQVANAEALEREAERLLAAPELMAEMAASGRALTEQSQKVRDALLGKVLPYLKPDGAYASA